MDRPFVWLFWLLLLALVGWVVNLVWYKPFSLNDFLERTTLQYAQRRPEEFSRHQFTGIAGGLSGFNGRLDPWPGSDSAEVASWARHNLRMLDSYFQPGRANPELDSLSAVVMRHRLADLAANRLPGYCTHPLNPVDGLQLSFLRLLLHHHRINDLKDAEHYLERLHQFHEKVNTLPGQLGQWPSLACAQQQLAHHQLAQWLAANQPANWLAKDFAQKMDGPLSNDAQVELQNEFNQVLENEVMPAYRRLLVMLDTTTCHSDTLVRLRPEHYAAQLRYHCTQPTDPQNLHQLGLQKVAALADSLVRLAARWAPGPDPAIQWAWLRAQTRQGPGQADSLRRHLAHLTTQLGFLFANGRSLRPQFGQVPLRPSGFWPYPGPLAPALDQPERLTYHWPTDDSLAGWRPYETLTVAARNLFPGYLYQKHQQVQSTDLPHFRRAISFTAFEQGWAAHCLLRLEAQGGLADPYQRLGWWHEQLVRWACLTADTGLHAHGWSRPQAYAYLRAHTALSEAEARELLNRLLVYPGEAVAFYPGQLAFQQAQQWVQRQLGPGLPWADYHAHLLQTGPVPLSLLPQVAKQYVWLAKRGIK
ncbi:MAG: DUF885 domain-containing protein [Bernardetiaceae bacterium]|jgi:uncharacterized protein (DUF885 family)|nr:DUF885 domain-containing protein [Bernardetiaceae bacterium]